MRWILRQETLTVKVLNNILNHISILNKNLHHHQITKK